MLESALDRLAQTDPRPHEASLSPLGKIQEADGTFRTLAGMGKGGHHLFIINAVRAKTHIFNEQLQRRHETGPEKTPKGKPGVAAGEIVISRNEFKEVTSPRAADFNNARSLLQGDPR